MVAAVRSLITEPVRPLTPAVEPPIGDRAGVPFVFEDGTVGTCLLPIPARRARRPVAVVVAVLAAGTGLDDRAGAWDEEPVWPAPGSGGWDGTTVRACPGGRTRRVDRRTWLSVDAVGRVALWGGSSTTRLVRLLGGLLGLQLASIDHAVRLWLRANCTDLWGAAPPPGAAVTDLLGWVEDRLGYPTGRLREVGWGPVPRTDRGWVEWTRIPPADRDVLDALREVVVVVDVSGHDAPGTGLVDCARIGALLAPWRRELACFGAGASLRVAGDASTYDLVGSYVVALAGDGVPVFPRTLAWTDATTVLGRCGWRALPADPFEPSGPFSVRARRGWLDQGDGSWEGLLARAAGGVVSVVVADGVRVDAVDGPDLVVVGTREDRHRALVALAQAGVRSIGGRACGDVVVVDPREEPAAA